MSEPGWTVSLNEVESISLKAARGAGAGWGVADDVARATRWMAARQLDWSGGLLALLNAGHVSDRLRPILRVADLLSGALPGDTWRLEGCAPAWAVAILSNALYGRDLGLDLKPITDLPLALRASRAAVRLDPHGGVSSDQDTTLVATAEPRDIVVTARAGASPLPHALAEVTRRSQVARSAWQALDAYAARTYVAPSAQSRATGAGGGSVDTD